ncbi:delta 1-pyrroline-5-carboxylate reductase [Savitreella phatthalungensis]
MTTLVVLGCGTMGRSILTGIFEWLRESKSGSTTPPPTSEIPMPTRFIAFVRSRATADRLSSEFASAGYTSEFEVEVLHGGSDRMCRVVEQGDVVLLGTKPQVAKSLFGEETGLRSALKNKLLISILAGTTIAQLEAWALPSTRIVRVMPNTPSRIRQGMSVVVPSPRLEELSRPATPAASGILPPKANGVSGSEGRPLSGLETVRWMFDAVGRTLVLDEKHMDAATALCGSGPAFMAVILESMTDGGVMMGLPRADAQLLAAQTMKGTADLVLTSNQHPAVIRSAVATPGGCTIGGLLEMEDGKVRSTVARTIQVATQIASGLGK